MTLSVQVQTVSEGIKTLEGLLNELDVLTSRYVFNISSDFFYQAFTLFDKIEAQCNDIFHSLTTEELFTFKRHFPKKFQVMQQQVSLIEIMLKQLETAEDVSDFQGTYYNYVSKVKKMESIVNQPLKFINNK